MRPPKILPGRKRAAAPGVRGRPKYGAAGRPERCPGCGELIDPADLDAVLAHADHGLIRSIGPRSIAPPGSGRLDAGRLDPAGLDPIGRPAPARRR